MSNSFNNSLGAALLPRGILVAEDGSLETDPLFAEGSTPSPQLLEYLNDRRHSFAIYSQVQVQWATDLNETITRIISGRSSEPEALRVVLFLRIHGFVVDFREIYRGPMSLVAGTTFPADSPAGVCASALAAVESLLSALTEDEQLYAEYRRHVDAHVNQAAYDIQWVRGQQTQRRLFVSKFTRKHYDVLDLRERLSKVVAAHSSELALAQHIATKIRASAVCLSEAVREFCAPVS